MRLFARSVLASSFVSCLVLGCVTSEPINIDPVSPQGAAGASSAPGVAGTSGGTAGTTGQSGSSGIADTSGMAGTNGQTGGSGQAGTTGQVGTTGQAGTSGQAGGGGQGGNTADGGVAGQAGRGGSTGKDAGASDGGSVPTFTELYTTLFNNTSYASNCTGSACHNPGTQKGLDFSTQAKGYSTVKGKISVGNPTGSTLMSQLSSGKMPQARPKMPAVDQAKISAWIKAGAPNN